VDYHFEALRLMGADIKIEGNDIVAKTDGLSGIEYSFPGKTVTGTENIIMAASMADGSSVLKNCALEPEIDDLILMLNKMGADIKRTENDTILIKGQTSLGHTDHRIIPDRIETGTYVILASLNGNEIVIKDTTPEMIKSLLDILSDMGINTDIGNGEIIVKPNKNMQPVKVVTETYPGLPTDLQAQLMVLLTQTEGLSEIKESIFNNRFNHANELNRMGADIGIDGNTARINGKTNLTGKKNIIASDLRASAALVLGALIADGKTTIKNSFQLFRGYERLPEKLRSLGADIRVIS
jgi:UDP-N-acetylglucosamine 1-carboxyvinyltransferase